MSGIEPVIGDPVEELDEISLCLTCQTSIDPPTAKDVFGPVNRNCSACLVEIVPNEEEVQSESDTSIAELTNGHGKPPKTRKREDLTEKILAAEPELDLISDELLCAVCWDLLHEPFEVIPCKHIFCETCLRRLGMKAAMNTTCPLCRTRIAICLPEKELSTKIRDEHHDMYSKRRNVERGTNIYNFPLPWTPGWRSLFAGKPFGGNDFKDQRLRDKAWRVASLVPHYFPPLLMAQMMNLIFILAVLVAFESLPRALRTIVQKSELEQLRREVAVTGIQPNMAKSPGPASFEQIIRQLSQPPMSSPFRRDALYHRDSAARYSHQRFQGDPFNGDGFTLQYCGFALAALIAAALSSHLMARQNLQVLLEDYEMPMFGTFFRRFGGQFCLVEIVALAMISVILFLPVVVQPSSITKDKLPSPLGGSVDPIFAFICMAGFTASALLGYITTARRRFWA